MVGDIFEHGNDNINNHSVIAIDRNYYIINEDI